MEDMAFVRTRYGEVWYTTIGDGNPLLLLHGNSMTASSQERLARLFADDHEVVSIDLLGHGNSARPEHLFSTNYFVMQGEALTDVLATLFPTTTVTVFGMSAGAIAAMNAVCEDASHIAALVLDSLFHQVSRQTLQAHRAHVRAVSPPWERYMRSQHGETWWNHLQAGLVAMIEELAASGTIVTPCLDHIDLPVLVFQGGQDAFCPESEGKTIVSRIPNARLFYDSGAGHILAWKYPIAFREIVREFLRSVLS
jgi:pimeloyl-ACP methyl ester carboxylesterase